MFLTSKPPFIEKNGISTVFYVILQSPNLNLTLTWFYAMTLWNIQI